MKKGQAAMEFLMTYGWAILVVIAAIAALAYFGVLDPARLLPERCQSSAGMDCIGHAAVQTTQIDFTLANNNPSGNDIEVYDLEIVSTTCTAKEIASGANGAYVDISSANVTVGNNEVFKVRYSGCSGLTSGNKFEDTVTVWYKDTYSGQLLPVNVDLRGRVI